MSSKVLQTPAIVEVIGSTIRVSHPNVKSNTQTFLTSPIAAGATAMSVADNNNIENSDWLLIGAIGDPESEEININAAVTRGSSLTVSNTLKFDHELSAPVTKIFERTVKIYGAATNGGAGTIIASVNSITGAINGAVPIQWNRQFTEWTLKSTDTAYAYYYATYFDGVTESSKSAYVPASGLASGSILPLINRSLSLTNSELDDKELTNDMMVTWSQECQDAVTQFTYKDPQSNKLLQKDWDFEIIEDSTSIIGVENENKYSLAALVKPMKYPNSDKSIVDIRIGVKSPMSKISIDAYDSIMEERSRTDTTAAANIGDTTLYVTSTGDFNSEGTLLIGTEVITYTGKTATTFTGIPATGTGSITAVHAIASPVWQNIAAGEPLRYVVFNGYVYFDSPLSADYAGQYIKIRYLKKLDEITKLSDTTTIPFTNVFPLYLSSRIEYRKQNLDKGDKWLERFNEQVIANAQASYTPVVDTFQYYNYRNDLDAWDEAWDHSDWQTHWT